MNTLFRLLIMVTVVIFASPLFGEPVSDLLIGKINLRNSSKLDVQAKRELAAFAAKIKKTKPTGTVKITGNISDAKSQEEYNDKSVFMAQLAEKYLKPLLSTRYQTYITASKYQAESMSGQNSLQINLYPHELRVEGAGFISTMTSSEEIPKLIEKKNPQSVTYPDASPQPTNSLLSKPVSDVESVEVTSKKEKLKSDNEDPVLANELVNKAKARAAQKAKRLEQEK